MKYFKTFALALISFLLLGYVNVNAENEAKIGDKEYATLVEAIQKVKEGEEIDVLKNVDLTSNFAADANLYVLVPDNVTVDLNEHTIKSNNNSIKYAGNNFTIKNGTFEVKGYGTESSGSYSLFLGAASVETSTYTLENLVLNGGLNVQNATDVVLKNVTANGTDYYSVWAEWNSTITIKSGNYSSQSGMVLGVRNSSDSSITLEGGNYTLGNGKLNCNSSQCKNPVVLGGTFDKVLDSSYYAEDTNITIKLENNVTLTSSVEIKGNVTLDLNGKTITAADSFVGDSVFTVLRNGKLTINDSKGNGKITTGTSGKIYSAVKMTKKGESATGDVAELVVNGGTLEGYYYAIVGNGGRHDTKITINDGKLLGLNEEDNLGIYHPQNGTLTINGGEITGLTGVEVRAGKLVVTGGKIIGTSTELKTEANGSGSTSIGGGITIAQHTTTLAIDAKISGGEISGKEALYVVFPEANPNKDIVKVEVSGGKFSTTVKDYLKENYAINKVDNKYEVYEKYNIRFAILENVEAVLSTEYAEIGEKVTLTLTPSAGFELSKILATANDNTNIELTKVSDTEYTFVMPDDEVAIIVKYTPIHSTEIPVVGEDVEVGVKDPEKTEEVLLESLNGVTDEEVLEVLENTSVKVKVEVVDLVATDETKAEFETALKDVKDATLVNYFDITVAVKNALTGEEITTLTDLSKEIELMVEIPADLEEVKEGYTRTYYIVREHDGKVELVKNVSVSEDGKHVVFSSKEFSTYALAYTDTLATTTPETGDNILYFVALGFISVAAIGMALNNLKRRTNR